jgi:hypothetical protein
MKSASAFRDGKGAGRPKIRHIAILEGRRGMISGHVF